MIARLIVAVVYGIIAALVCILLGTVIGSIGAGPKSAVWRAKVATLDSLDQAIEQAAAQEAG